MASILVHKGQDGLGRILVTIGVSMDRVAGSSSGTSAGGGGGLCCAIESLKLLTEMIEALNCHPANCRS